MVESSSLADAQLAEIYRWSDQRTFRLNMLLTADGKAHGVDGTSQSLTSDEDRRILRIIRADADVVILGAQSIRSEGWFLPPRGRIAVLSHSGNIPWDTCPDKSRVSVYPSIPALIHSLGELDKNILCEGGLETAAAIALQVGFDEIALTRVDDLSTSPIPKSFGTASEYRCESILTDESNKMSFQFWRRAVEQQ